METKNLLQNLLKLQALEFGEAEEREMEKQIAELRVGIPLPILGHYDRLRERGKKGVAAVRNQVCTGCHMRVPRASVIYLMQGTDIQVCESCGAYLYLPDSEKAGSAEVHPVGKPVAKLTARKEMAHAV
jgi:hypothetical protein